MVAKPFLNANIAVAIVGYRTYPDGNVPDQVDDLHMAATKIAMEYPHLLSKPQINDGSDTSDNDDWVGVCLMGHSSGATILFRIRKLHSLSLLILNDEIYFDEMIRCTYIDDVSCSTH